MANAAVEKLKEFSLHHAEKVVVGALAALCVVLFVLAGSRPTIDVTPDQIQNDTRSAEANIDRPQKTEDILARLDEENLVLPDFSKKVADSQVNKGEKLAFTGPPLVFPEPGAGLIRETPNLIAPTELYATSGRGSIPVFELDPAGNLVYEEKKDEKKVGTAPRRRRPNRFMMPDMSMPGTAKSRGTEAERKKWEAAEAQRLADLLVGSVNAAEKQVAEDIAAHAQHGRMPKEVNKGFRWVSVVGALDHRKLKGSYVAALKDASAAPHYLRLDVQRRELAKDRWAEWKDVDRAANENVLAYVTLKDEELTPDEVRLEGLVDFLPFLQVGSYRGVHLADLVPEDVRNPKPAVAPAAGRMGASSSSVAQMMMQQQAQMADMPGPGAPSPPEMMGMPGRPMPGGQGPADVNFPKTNAARVMVRSLDFTVRPDVVYQYRVRVVVRNPNLGWESVKPGTDTTTEELPGPWSEPTQPVRVPADVTTYALQMAPGSARDGSVQFQVVKWNEADGLTIVKTFDEAPGQVIGENAAAPVPKDDGKGRTSKAIDFTSRQVIVDVNGGERPLAPVGLASAKFDAPALAVVLRPDGVLAVRDQARDTYDAEMRQLKDIYDQILRDADQGGKQPPAMMSPSSGSMMRAPR